MFNHFRFLHFHNCFDIQSSRQLIRIIFCFRVKFNVICCRIVQNNNYNVKTLTRSLDVVIDSLKLHVLIVVFTKMIFCRYLLLKISRLKDFASTRETSFKIKLIASSRIFESSLDDSISIVEIEYSIRFH